MKSAAQMSPREALLAASHREHPPGRLQLGEDMLALEGVLRRLPDKRLVVQGTFRSEAVVAKFFLDRRRAAVHCRREREGLARLAASGLHTPAVLAERTTRDGVPVLITRFLAGAEPLARRWPAASPVDKQTWLAELARCLARLHGAGLRHEDLHFGNVLVLDGGLALLDGDAVTACTDATSALDNLALLLAQLPALDRSLADATYAVYAQARGQEAEPERFRARLYRINQRRLGKAWGKFQRSCAAVHVQRGVRRWFACARPLANHPEWAQFLAHPERWFEPDRAQFLKRGNSATVVRTRLVDRDVVIKRYNIKNPLHGLMLALRPISRARNAWCSAWLLDLLGLVTPAPLAVLETRWWFWKRQAYLVTDWTPARDCREVLAESAEPGALQTRIGANLRALSDAGLSHGDLKASNVLIDGEDRVVLIDLDSMRLQRRPKGLGPAAAEDRRRFLANWDDATLRAGFGLD